MPSWSTQGGPDRVTPGTSCPDDGRRTGCRRPKPRGTAGLLAEPANTSLGLAGGCTTTEGPRGQHPCSNESRALSLILKARESRACFSTTRKQHVCAVSERPPREAPAGRIPEARTPMTASISLHMTVGRERRSDLQNRIPRHGGQAASEPAAIPIAGPPRWLHNLSPIPSGT